MESKKYPIGGYAPGNYSCTCCKCGTEFSGDKRAVECEQCAVSAKEKFDALSPDEQAEVIKRNIEEVNKAFSDWTKKPDVNLAIVGHGKPALYYPGSYYQPLFDLLHQEHGITPLESEMTDIIFVVEKMRGKQPGPRWVKASDFKYEMSVTYHAHIGVTKGAGWFDTVEGDDIFNWSDGGDTLQCQFKDLYILDEQPAAVSQDAHEKEIMMQAFAKVRKIFEGRQWVMDGRGSYPYNDDRYKEEVRYMYNEFDEVVKDTWANIKSKSVDYRKAIIAEYLGQPAAGREQWVNYKYGIEEQWNYIKLPPGNWQFICTTKEVRAMHAPALFGYAMINDYYAQMTINSLLTSKGLDVNKNYCLLKKK